MMPCIRLLVTVGASGLFSATAQVETVEAAPSGILTVCEVLSAPLKYDGHIVTIRGRLDGTNEDNWLIGDDCPGVFVTGDHVWPSVVSLAMPTIDAHLRVHPVNFQFDWEAQRRFDAKHKTIRKSVPANCLAVTYSGMFETRTDWSTAKLVYPNGAWRYAGFGHLGDAPGHLLLKSEDDIAVVPGCGGDKGHSPKGTVKK
jgi:hypothetical protein